MTRSSTTGPRPIDVLCAKMAAANAPQLPFPQAAAEGALGLLMINSPAIAWPSATVAAYGSKPLVALVGADLGFGSEDVGPDEWTCARRLRYWKPNAVIIHGAAGEIAHYRLGVALALTVGRLAFIECSSRRVEEWRRFLGCPHTVAILPEGGVHPVAPAVRH